MVVDNKRKAEESALVPVNKKSRSDVALANKNKQLVQTSVPRTSNLFAPIMLLEGHEGDVFTLDFHPEGQYLASSGFDRRIFVWSVYGECENVSVMSGHTGAVMQLKFSPDGGNVYTASTDHTLGLWDFCTGQRLKKYKGHSTFVNCLGLARRGPQTIVSGGDDAMVKLWDTRKKNCVSSINNAYQVTAVTFNDTAEQVFSGGIDNDIKVWDVRKNELLYTMRGHTDTVTGLSLSPDGSYLLSNGMDNSLRVWDVRPYAPQERCIKVFTGHQHNFEKNLLRCGWSSDGSKVSAGSADRFVYVWDTTSRRILYKLPGHNGSVNDVGFHPNEPIVVSGSSDKQIYLGEIDPMLRVHSGNSLQGFTEFEEDIHFDDDDPDFDDRHRRRHVSSISVPIIITVPTKMSMASVHPVEVHSSHSSLTTLSHSLDDISSWSSQVEQVMTIEQLRDQMTSCFTCGVSWTDRHVSLDCSECGGYAMERPCPTCDGSCGATWKRDLTMSHASSKARWQGECHSYTTAPAAPVKDPATALIAQELCQRLEKLSANS